MSGDIREALSNAADRAAIRLSDPQLDALERYLRLLIRWNRRINLTSLDLEDPSNAALDRLVGEPLRAGRILAEPHGGWFDLGSGGGSPAIPLKIFCPGFSLTMVEARAKKAAFLREAIREVGLTGADVISGRYEELLERSDLRGTARLVSARAVRQDATLIATARHLLAPGGHFMLFREKAEADRSPDGFAPEDIPPGSPVQLWRAHGQARTIGPA